jgi:hypothetical protein
MQVSSTRAAALYERDACRFVPSELTRGPWHPEAQHGGPPCALLAQETALFENGDEMFVARLTVELLRPVPLSPLAMSVSMARPGRKVQLVTASLVAGNVEVARAVALRIRRTSLPLPPTTTRANVPRGPATASTFAWNAQTVAYHSHAVEHRFVRGAFDQLGPATDWIRLRQPLIAGEETAPLARVAAAADFGNGISAVLLRADGYSFINPDLTLYLHRHPVGEWVCLDATTTTEPHGCGLAESRLYDEGGAIGRSLQSLLVERS